MKDFDMFYFIIYEYVQGFLGDMIIKKIGPISNRSSDKSYHGQYGTAQEWIDWDNIASVKCPIIYNLMKFLENIDIKVFMVFRQYIAYIKNCLKHSNGIIPKTLENGKVYCTDAKLFHCMMHEVMKYDELCPSDVMGCSEDYKIANQKLIEVKFWWKFTYPTIMDNIKQLDKKLDDLYDAEYKLLGIDEKCPMFLENMKNEDIINKLHAEKTALEKDLFDQSTKQMKTIIDYRYYM